MQRFSFGETPKDVITEACKRECPDGFNMTIRSKDEWAIIAGCWNQGIDSHLEAITLTRSSADASTGEILIHPEELHVLLRRLYEDGSDDAWMLRTDILTVLNIDEV